MSLGKRIKELRKTKNLTQIEFAKLFQISSGTIAMWETDKRQPDFTTLQKLADFFGVSTDYLLGRTENALDRRPASDIAENFIKEFGELFSDENFQKLAGIYKVMNEIQRREILLYLIGYARGAGIDTKIIGY